MKLKNKKTGETPELLDDTNDTNMGDNEELIKLIEQEEKDGE